MGTTFFRCFLSWGDNGSMQSIQPHQVPQWFPHAQWLRFFTRANHLRTANPVRLRANILSKSFSLHKRNLQPPPLFSLSSLYLSLSEIASASDSNRRILRKLWVKSIFIPISCFDFVPYLGVFNLGVCCWTLGLKFQTFPVIAKWEF